MIASIKDRTIKVIAAFADMTPDKVDLGMTFEQLGIDSLGGAALVYDLEEEFEISIPNEEALKIRTVQEAVESLARNLPEGGGAGHGGAAGP